MMGAHRKIISEQQLRTIAQCYREQRSRHYARCLSGLGLKGFEVACKILQDQGVITHEWVYQRQLTGALRPRSRSLSPDNDLSRWSEPTHIKEAFNRICHPQLRGEQHG